MSIARALVSVSDKRGLVSFVRRLAERRVEILSTGGTARALREAGVSVRDVAEHTGSPEIMDGRVKTLHPRVHGGILMRDLGRDREELASIGGAPIDLVVVNLYPFAATAARADATHEDIVEQIDIGGPSMVRSAAKNHARVAVVVDPDDYDLVLAEIERDGVVGHETRAGLAAKAFAHTAAYDAAIAGYLTSRNVDGSRDAFAGARGEVLERVNVLRYGENPHQGAALYRHRDAGPGTLARAASVGAGGKELSFNNLVDLDGAIEAVLDLAAPGAVVVKHASPSGACSALTAAEAYRSARDADGLSAFGGVVALNCPVDDEAARVIAETFIECVAAPAFTEGALATLRAKKNLRIVELGDRSTPIGHVVKSVSGGLLVQDSDRTGPGEVASGRVVTKRTPTSEELEALDFAWRVCKHVRSNAIVLARGTTTVGIGGGQPSRVDAVKIAVTKAGESARGAALASDAFFPFPDGVEAAAAAGVTAIAQPGGSVKDDAVIAAADRLGIAMVFTGVRHFRH
ncbi:MAG: bifunctional phosphoribosylaminoimidazolecarboxamide formyltransferase/IMP cyclohydrolase [Deltaproteobacteria bacterium]|nr:bifunctional phosphoribosylaminoimidazolecarboxamide formyltransferase/IMP cyclohydrolase [Deltaproteobacteria bacterium]